jgi:hypothetical protein
MSAFDPLQTFDAHVIVERRLWSRDMNRRKVIGAVALGFLLLLALGLRYIGGISQDDWDPMWSIAYVLAFCVALFTTFTIARTSQRRHGTSIPSAASSISS